MNDRKKVIKEAEEAIDILAKAEEPTFWMDFVRCAFENALALLKEQEPVKPFPHHDIYWCGKCGNRVLERHTVHDTQLFLVYKYKFCPECGRMVKWDD